MTNTLLKKALFVSVFLLTTVTSAQITLTSETVSEYVEKILGPNITFSNVQLVGSPQAIASFENGVAGGLSPYLESGIVLSTGRVDSLNVLNGPSTFLRSSNLTLPGFPELNSISNVITHDGIMLQFDFIPTNESINIKFQFGSEEYNDWVNSSFNDVFAFFISGHGIEGEKNIALVPLTEDRITINTINQGGPTGGCGNGVNASNPMFYIDNCLGIHNNAMDGFTTHLTAFSEVTPNETYTIKLMLADGSDSVLDSWVFLQAGGFSSDEIPEELEIVYEDQIPTSNYDQNNIGSKIMSINSSEDNSDCSNDIILSVEVPEGYQISNLKVQYTMTSYNGAVATEQRSMLYSPTLGIGEDTVSEGSYNYPGEEHYSREVSFANGATGTVDFVLNAWRTSGSSGCNSDYSYVNGNTWALIPEFEPYSTNSINNFDSYNFSYYPNPVNNILHLNSNTEITEVSIFNMIGQKLDIEFLPNNNTQLDLYGLSSGSYLIQINIQGSIKTFKIVRQ